MALYNRFEVTVLNSAGEPVVGCSVEPRKQGATANTSGTTPNVLVHAVGAIVSGDTVAVDLGTGVLCIGVLGPTSPTIQLLSGVTITNDVSRLTVTNLPTVYNDMDGTEAKANIVTDANGMAFWYAPYAAMDVAIATTAVGQAPSGPAQPQLRTDQFGYGGTFFYSPVISNNAQADHFVYDTIRAMTALGNIAVWKHAGTTKLSLDRDGDLTLVSGSVLTAFGAIFNGVLQAAAGFTHTGGSFSVVAGSIITAALAANAVHPAPSTTTGSAADATPGTSETVRITTSYTPTSGNVGCRISVNLPYIINGAINTAGRLELRLYVGGVLKATGFIGGSTGANEVFNNQGTIAFTWEEPTMAASPTTIEVRDIRIDTAGTTAATYKGTIYAGYMTIQELKK